MSKSYAPLEITQGTTVEWTMSNSTYLASTYTATFKMVSASGSLSSTATADGDDYDFALTPAQTTALHPGSYKYQVTVTDGTDTYLIESGYIYVLPNLSQDQVLGAEGASLPRQRYMAYSKLLTNEAYIKTMGPDQIAALEDMVRRLEWDLRREDETERQKRDLNTCRKVRVSFTL